MNRGRLFWCAGAAALCAAIWFGLPILRESAPEAYGKLSGIFGIPASDAPEKPEGAETPAEEDWELAEAEEGRAEPLATPPAAPTIPETPTVAQAPHAPAAATPPRAPDNDPDEPRPPTSPAPNWGVAAAAKTGIFDASGAKRGWIPAGSIVAWTRRTTIPSQPGKTFAECYLLRSSGWQPETFLADTADLVLFEGATYEETDPAQRKAAGEYFSLLGRYETLRAAAEARTATARRNPHEEEYRAAKAKFDDVQNEVNAIMARVRWSDTHDLPGGVRERGQLLQRAQALRPVQNEAHRQFNPIREKWEAWEAAHPASAAPPVSTPDMRLLEKELDRLRPEVAKFVPGL